MNTFGLGQKVYAFDLGRLSEITVSDWREVVRFLLAVARVWRTDVER